MSGDIRPVASHLEMDMSRKSNTESHGDLTRRGVVVGAAAASGVAIAGQKAAGATLPGQVNIFGLAVYANPLFLAAMNRNYSSQIVPSTAAELPTHKAASITYIQRSVNRIIAAGLNPSSVQWGQYQTAVLPQDQWPADTYRHWVKSTTDARTSLGNQFAWDGIISSTKVAVLDAAVQKCFSSTPPIPIIIDVKGKSASDSTRADHDIYLEWKNDPSGNPPEILTLYLTMVCPFNS
jgi:hypothetical protein